MALYWVLLGAAIITSVAGQALLKASAGAPDLLTQFLDLRSIAGLFLYGGACRGYGRNVERYRGYCHDRNN